MGRTERITILIFMVFIVFLLTSGTSFGMQERGVVRLDGKVREVEKNFVVVGDSILRLKPALAEVTGKIQAGEEVKDIAIDEGRAMIYVLQEVEDEDMEEGHEDNEEMVLKALELDSGEVVATVEIKAMAIEAVPEAAAVVALGKDRRELLVLDSEALSLRYKIEVGRKVSFMEACAGSGRLVLVMEPAHEEKRHHHRRHKGHEEKDRACVGVVSLWDGAFEAELCFSEKIEAVSVDGGSSEAVVMTRKGKVYLVELAGMQKRYLLKAPKHSRGVLLSGGRVFVTDHKRGTLWVYDSVTGQPLESFLIGRGAEHIARAGIYYLVSYKEGIKVFREEVPPEVEAIEPGEVQAGAGDVEVLLRGRWFMPGAEVLIDDVATAATYISEEELKATVPSSYTETPSSHRIKVRNPDGRLSNEVGFLVRVPEPYISTVVPIETDAGTGAMVLELYGSGFLPETRVYYDGKQRSVTYIKETKLQVELLPEDTAVAGVYGIYAENTDYDGTVVRSNTFEFTVNNPVPVVSSITPSEVVAGSGDTAVTITGSGFVSGSEVYFNGQAIAVDSYTYTSIRATVPSSMLTEPGQYAVVVKNPPPGGGLSSEVLLTVKPALEVEILYPADGTTLNRAEVTVKGIFKADSRDVGITVNGVVADIVGNEWVVNGVRLSEGQNTIVATITDSTDSTATDTIVINTTDTTQAVRLRASVTSGIPSLQVYFDVESSFIPVSYSMDFDGDGIVDYSGSTFEGVSHTYSTEGIYTATVTVTDTAGNEYSDSITIVVLNRQEIDTLLRQKWEGMKERLGRRDVEGALQYFLGLYKETYRRAFSVIIDRLPQVVSNMEDIELIYLFDNVAKYRITRTMDIDGVQRVVTFYIYFSKDSKGVWRIDRF